MVSPGHPDYRHDLTESVSLRWSNAGDRAGCALLSVLAPGIQEGEENEFAVRYFDVFTEDEYFNGSSTEWAVCVDRSGGKLSVEAASPSAGDAPKESEYMASIRKEASEAKEKVVALIFFSTSEYSFGGDASRLLAGKAQIVACRSSYRKGTTGTEIMRGLFDMIYDRGKIRGYAFHITSGIPWYYRNHGFEYGIRLGPLLTTYLAGLPASSKAITEIDSSAKEYFKLRRATENDLPIIEDLVLSQRGSAQLFSSSPPEMLRGQLRWLLGHRSESFQNPAYQPGGPFYVLEKWSIRSSEHKLEAVVAALGLQNTPTIKSPQPIAAVHPLLWDGKEDASKVASVAVQHLTAEINALLEKQHTEEKAQAPAPKLGKINWVVSDGHPLRRWLLANQLATVVPETSLYDSHGSWWVNIPSLPIFAKQLIPAFNARLQSVKSEFGSTYSAELKIIVPSTSIEGVKIKIVNCKLVEVAAVQVTSKDLRQDQFGAAGPNVALPRGAMTQLFMGFKSWSELRNAFPDMVALPRLVPVLEVLFPKVVLGSQLYF